MKLPIGELVCDLRCQTRAAVDAAAVDDYRDAYLAGAPLPPIRVFRVAGAAWIVDGFHRFYGAAKAGVTWLDVVEVGSGSEWYEAEYAALGLNQANGLRRSHEDKHYEVLKALANPIASEQSSRLIAEKVGVSHDFVARLRKAAEAASSEPAPTTRVDSKGRRQPARKPPRVSSNDTSSPEATDPEPGGSIYGLRGGDPDGYGLPESYEEIPSSQLRPEHMGLEPGAGTPLDDATPSVLPAYADDYAQQADAILALRRVVVTALGRHGEATHQTMHRVRDALTDAARILGHATPVVCPQCQGPGCRRCGERGWIEAGQRTQSEAAE